jgi:hypothetical protein
MPQTSRKIDLSKLAAYTAAGVAASVCGSPKVHADITYEEVNVAIGDDSTGDGGIGLSLILGDASSFQFGLAHDLGGDDETTGVAFARGNLFGGLQPGASFAGFTAGAFNYVSNLAQDIQLSTLTSWIDGTADGTMAFNAGYTNSQFADPGPALLGLRFDNGSGFAYGWIRVEMNGNPLNSFTIVDTAYADPGEALAAGQISAVPEPGSLGILALGAVGTVAWRRHRKQAA